LLTKGSLTNLYPEDKIALSFSVLILIIQLWYFFSGFLTDTSKFLFPAIAFALLLMLIYFQNRSSYDPEDPSLLQRSLKFTRSYYHVLYYAIIFNAFQTFVHEMNPNDFDIYLLKYDILILGADPTVWFEKHSSRFLTELFAVSYASYYILPSLTFIVIYTLKGADSFLKARNYLLAYCIGLYAAFIFYVLLPAAGPDLAFPENYSIPLTGLTSFSTEFLKNLAQYLKDTEARNTFPSMHFAVLIVINYFAFLYRRKYFLYCTLPLGILLAVATVYLRQHYFVDLLGSIPIAALSIYFALKINKKYRTLS
jgi:membrane-associated phospholipid phosphatase